jgi:hypothetical protein
MRFQSAVLAVLLSSQAGTGGGVPQFRQMTVTSGLKSGYQLVVADLNVDGKPDIIVIDERATELAWFENPMWERHTLATGVPRTINLEVWDWDRDGKPDIAMAHNFETNPEKSVGNVLLLKSAGDARQPWVKQEIDRVPTAHRIRWIDPKGDGRKLLVVAPLVGLKARAPDYADNAPVYLYKPGEWKRIVLTEEPKGVLHSIAPVAWDRSGEQLFTASFSGIHLYRYRASGAWVSEEIAKGDPRACPECGSSEIKTGRLGNRRLIAAIEPWHGNQVVVYTQQGKRWERRVIESGMVNGHALAVGDLDGDNRDEIVAGFRGKGFHLSVFSADDAKGTSWSKHVIDPDKMAAADCKIADFNGDGRPDIACSGASTGNVKLYLNEGAWR